MSPTFIRRNRSFGRVELECHGVLDATNGATLRAELGRLGAGTVRQVTIDLRHVANLDASGVAALASTAVAMRRQGVELRIVEPRDRGAGRILDYSGLVPLLAA